MAKVIIEVKSLQNNDLIGKLVISNSGRDKNQMYVIVDNIDDSYYLLSNWKTKTIQMPKKKKLKHFDVLGDAEDHIKTALAAKDKGADLKIKRFLKLKGIVKEGWLPYVKRWCNRNARCSFRSFT